MADPADHPFRWEDLDQRLLSPKVEELTTEMQERAVEGELHAQLDTRQSGNSGGYLLRLFDFHEPLTDEWAEDFTQLIARHGINRVGLSPQDLSEPFETERYCQSLLYELQLSPLGFPAVQL